MELSGFTPFNKACDQFSVLLVLSAPDTAHDCSSVSDVLLVTALRVVYEVWFVQGEQEERKHTPLRHSHVTDHSHPPILRSAHSETQTTVWKQTTIRNHWQIRFFVSGIYVLGFGIQTFQYHCWGLARFCSLCIITTGNIKVKTDSRQDESAPSNSGVGLWAVTSDFLYQRRSWCNLKCQVIQIIKADWILEASYISIFPWAAQDDGLFVRHLIGWKEIEKSGNKNVVLFLF